MGVYDTKQLPIWKYLHSAGAPHYVLADRFFQAAFGGSFLNHQYLVAARAPRGHQRWSGWRAALGADANAFPATYPLYTPTRSDVVDGQLTQACGPDANPSVACGDYAVNTVQPGEPAARERRAAATDR